MADESKSTGAQDESSEKPKRRTIDKLHLVNFTAFKALEMKFSPGINAITGENATGKTHVLKALHAACEYYDSPVPLEYGLIGVFAPEVNSISSLYNRLAAPSNAILEVTSGNDYNRIEFSRESDGYDSHPDYSPGWFTRKSSSIYIPANSLLADLNEIAALAAKHDIFDLTYRTLSEWVNYPRSKGHWERELNLLERIQDIVKGKTRIKNGKPYIISEHMTLEMSLAAEGWKKLSLIYLLIDNAALRSDSVLIWDEPDSNLNPKLVKNIVEIMLMLEEMGVQILFATHDYVVLSWLDLLAKEKHRVKYHALYRDESDDIKCESSEVLSEIKNNAILDTYAELYDAELERAKSRIDSD